MVYQLSNYRPGHDLRLPKLCFNAFIIASLVLSAAALGQAQRGSGSILTFGSGKNILEGDLKVDESLAGPDKPLSYSIVLYLPGGTIVGRTTVSNGQRYRFLDLIDGEYDVAVEVENREITRSRVRLYSQPNIGKTDVRFDIELEFRATGFGTKGVKPATVSVEDSYKRSDSNEKLFNTAHRFTDEKKYDQAISSLRQLLDSDAKDFQAWTELGTVYLLKESYGDAEKSYLSAIEARPSFFLADFDLGRLYLVQNKFDKAIEVLKRAVEIKPESADANQLLGEAYLQVKKGSVAVGYLNEAVRLDPKGKADVHLRLALLYNNAGMKAKAATEYEEFLKQRPDYKDRKKLEQYIADNKKP
jgi:tetratricopeptide (TPR) repeat protein